MYDLLQAIKMWNLTSVGGKITPRFCRDFPGSSSCCGHSTGITCVAKVDEKGRFLSASKDCVLKLWDSRFNCDDDSGDGDDRVLLATFDKITKRAIKHIAIIEDGKYVRPTDNVDMTMAITVVRKSLQDGSNSVQKAARERQIIECSCEFATISEKCKLVKLWSVIHAGQVEEEGGNVVELTKTHELKHDAVVQSITSMRGKGMILTGDSIGHVRLWQSGRNGESSINLYDEIHINFYAATSHFRVCSSLVFLPNSSYVWTCARTFSWRQNSYIMSVQENCLAAITSLTFLHRNMFVSGSRSGILRVWTVDGTKSNGETITKEDICINGAHNLSVTAVRQVRSRDGNVSFSSASEDGKVLSFTIPISIDGDRIPRCFNVVNHGITNRYFPDPTHQVRVVSLCCLSDPDNLEDVLVTGTTNSDGFFHVLRPPKQGMQNDALVLHRQSIIDESLTMFDIAEKICNDVESKSRKLYLITYQGCFLGSEAVSYLVDHGYAASRKDAVDLGRVLASHLSLFECASKKGKLFVDDEKSYYRFSEAFLATPSSQRRRVSSEG
jgi:WD40 repeat protein